MMNEVKLIDCMEFMKDVPDKYYELAIVDPPYGIGADNMSMGTNKNRSGRNKQGEICYSGISTAVKLKKNRLNSGGGKLKGRLLNNSDTSWDIPPDKEYFEELFRISKNQIIWGGNYFPLPPTRCIICWDKVQPWENFSQFELAWTSFDSPAQMFRYSNTGGANKETKIHPTQKPISMYKWLLSKYAGQNYKIFDSHVGSGSIRIACHDMGFDFTGCELDADYWEAQEERIKNYAMQGDLFSGSDLQSSILGGTI